MWSVEWSSQEDSGDSLSPTVVGTLGTEVHCQVLSDRRQHVSEQQNRARVANLANWECGVGTHSCMGMLRLVTTGVMENPAGTPEEGTAHPTTTTATAAAVTIMLRTSRVVVDTRPASHKATAGHCGTCVGELFDARQWLCRRLAE